MRQLGLKRQIETGVREARRSVGFGPKPKPYTLVQEEAGIHVGISADLPEAAQHAAQTLLEKYNVWWDSGRFASWGQYKRQFFTVAVGGGNTLKAQYQVMVADLHSSIDWIGHVRFFFLEESSGEPGWESAEASLTNNFLVPLAQKLIEVRGIKALAKELSLSSSADENAVIDQIIATLMTPMYLVETKQALDAGNRPLALKRAKLEAQNYQRDIQNKLGATMEFHYIISGIGKNGTIGAFEPYMRELGIKDPGVIVVKRGPKAIRIALNRGVLINAECISLIVSGNLKLRALGRFEMKEATDFEQTVMETPLRMLRETYDIAEKVYIFADEQSLHFEETQFNYTEQGVTLHNKAETREGTEEKGVHILLLHGFMGLFSFTNFLVRLPSAWTVSALHRGSLAKTLSDDDIFPHYARVLRQSVLGLWKQGRPTPLAGHSIAGIILDHLLLSLLDDYNAPIPPYEKLKGNNRNLVDALRAGGIIHLATWAPTDGLHTRENIKAIISHYRHQTDLDYSGFDQIYQAPKEHLETTEAASVSDENGLSSLGRFLDTRLAEPLVNGLNVLMRSLLNNKTVQQKMLNSSSPYVLRLVGNRLLKTASFYGLCKEINAAMHDPIEYQKRHLRALDIILEYDIPFLSIVHEDDFLVSAQRHKEEYDYLLAKRKMKEGVSREAELRTTVRYISLKRRQEDLAVDPLNPHLLIMGTSNEANHMARQITAAMTRFVNENIGRAPKKGKLKSLASVRKWLRANARKPRKPKTPKTP